MGGDERFSVLSFHNVAITRNSVLNSDMKWQPFSLCGIRRTDSEYSSGWIFDQFDGCLPANSFQDVSVAQGDDLLHYTAVSLYAEPMAYAK